MSQKRVYFSWLEPIYRRVPFARFLLWQARFLTQEGARSMTYNLASEFADEISFRLDDTRWTIPTRDHSLSLGVFMNNDFAYTNETILLEWARMQGRLPQCDTILELGANIGSSTIPFLQSTDCRVVAVEPVPRNLRFLKENIKQNGFCERATIVERAIGEEAGTATMTVPLTALGGSELDHNVASRVEPIFRGATETVTVETMAVDPLLRELSLVPERVAFVWCDIQGSEGAVIRTGASLWQNGVPFWAEIAPLLLARHGDLQALLADTSRWFDSYLTLPDLKAQGVGAQPRPIVEFQALVAELGDKQADVLFLPRSSPQ